MSSATTEADIKAIGSALHDAAERYYNVPRKETTEQRGVRVWTLQFLWDAMNKPVYEGDTRTRGLVIAMTCRELRVRGVTETEIKGLTRAEQLVAQLRQDGAI